MKFLILISLLSLYFKTAFALDKPAHDLKIFYKCYAKLLNDYPLGSHKLVVSIKSKKITGRQACISLFNNISFDPSGHFTPNSQEALTIVSNLQKFYNSWVKMKNLNLASQDFVNTDYFDMNESSYPLTYALFSNTHYSNIFRGNNYFRAIRKGSPPNRFLVDKYITGFRFATTEKKWIVGAQEDEEKTYGPLTEIKAPQLVEVGDLIGINPNSPTPNQISYKGHREKGYLFYPQKPKGAGVLGTIPYLLANTGQVGIKTMSAFNYDRRWSASIFRDFMCQELPLLKEGDVQHFVKPKSSIGFIQKAKCMKCHVSMDYMAATLRNMERYNTGPNDGNFTTKAIFTHPITRKRHFGDELPVKFQDLYHTPPEGKVYFRDIKGNLIAKDVDSLEEVGEVITQTDAPYYCAVKRHFQYLTGIDIPMSQIKEAFQSGNKPKVIQFIIHLSENFKKHGSLKKLMASIVNSEYFFTRR